MKKWFKNWLDVIRLFKLIRHNSEKFQIATGIWGLVDVCIETGQPRMAKIEMVGIKGQPTHIVDFWVCPSPGSPHERITALRNQRQALKDLLSVAIKSEGTDPLIKKEAELMIKVCSDEYS
ncbi:MAG: hypothetical protein V4547_18310 [Bacteroidota bacterium]